MLIIGLLLLGRCRLKWPAKSSQTTKRAQTLLFHSSPSSSCKSKPVYRLQRRTNCHRPGVNWQLHVATCTIKTQHFSAATVPKWGPCPPSADLQCVDGLTELVCSCLPVSGEKHTPDPCQHTEGPPLGNKSQLHTITLNNMAVVQRWLLLQGVALKGCSCVAADEQHECVTEAMWCWSVSGTWETSDWCWWLLREINYIQ